MSINGLCGCMRCHRERKTPLTVADFEPTPGFRFACEVCGNKRCPHHTDHLLACTGSNATGQPGSDFA